MLVRAWNPRTGMLIGWLPNHNMAMGFELVDKKKALRFDPNEALTITWIKQDGEKATHPAISSCPPMRVKLRDRSGCPPSVIPTW